VISGGSNLFLLIWIILVVLRSSLVLNVYNYGLKESYCMRPHLYGPFYVGKSVILISSVILGL